MRLACLVIIAVLAVGVWANFPYLFAEHRRLEPWKAVGLWFGDFTALLWFAAFAFAHGLRRKPLVKIHFPDGKRRLIRLAAIGGVAMLIDLGFTFSVRFGEKSGYQRAVTTNAEVLSIKTHKRPEATSYDLSCRFRDAAGGQHVAYLRVRAGQHEFPPGLLVDTGRLLKEGRVGGTIRIKYDPGLPERAWADDVGWADENGLFWFSLSALFGQAAGALLLTLFLVPSVRANYWPWWWEVHKFLPLAAEAFCMLAMGLIDRFMDSIM